jgi:hypothetical protein
MRNKDIAAALNLEWAQVDRWSERYGESRLAGIERDSPRQRAKSTMRV